MDKFARIAATACPLNATNINTDQLLPARYLKWPRAAGLGKVLLQDLRFDTEGRELPDFPLTARNGATRKSSSPAAISVAAPRAKRPFMRCMTTAFAA